MLKLITAALFVVMVFYTTNGFVFLEPVKEEYQVIVSKYCKYDNTRFETGEQITVNCTQCNCGEDYMVCQGIGYDAGVMMIPECTQVRLANCCYQFVRNDNSSIPCTEVKCP